MPVLEANSLCLVLGNLIAYLLCWSSGTIGESTCDRKRKRMVLTYYGRIKEIRM